LDVNTVIADNLKANFNKQLDDLAKEALKFMGTEISGGDYEAPADDTKNIANAANYFIEHKDLVPGSQVFTNPFATNYSGKRIPVTAWDTTIVLSLIRWITGNKGW
jgi:hypothetical protein